MRLDDAIGDAMRSAFPDWTPGQGACDRCAQVYQVAIHQRQALED